MMRVLFFYFACKKKPTAARRHSLVPGFHTVCVIWYQHLQQRRNKTEHHPPPSLPLFSHFTQKRYDSHLLFGPEYFGNIYFWTNCSLVRLAGCFSINCHCHCFDFGSSSPLPPPPALRYTTCTINKYEQQQLSLHTTTKPAIPLLMSSITKTPKRKFLVELYLRL